MTHQTKSFAMMRMNVSTLIAIFSVSVLTACNAAPGGSDQRGAGGAQNPPAPVATSIAVNTGSSAVARGGSRSKATAAATVEILLPGETAVARGGSVQVSGDGPIRFEIASAVYDVSGKPVNGCGEFDSKSPARRFTIKMNLVNGSETDLTSGTWGAAAYSGDARATLCLSGSQSALPTIKKGATAPIELAAFVGPDESVTALDIGAANGLNSRICFEGERVTVCK